MPLVYSSSSDFQYCYSYTEIYILLKLIIYHDSTCELIRMIVMQSYFLHIKRHQTSMKTIYEIEEKVGMAVKKLSNKSSS